MLSPDWKDRLPLTSNSDRIGMRYARYARLLKNGRFHDSKFSLSFQSSQTSIIKNEMDEQRVEVMITDRDQVLTS